jgi:DNA relaxase NicK
MNMAISFAYPAATCEVLLGYKGQRVSVSIGLQDTGNSCTVCVENSSKQLVTYLQYTGYNHLAITCTTT